MKPQPGFLFLLFLALLCAAFVPLTGNAGDTGVAGTWTAEEQGVRVRLVLGADGTFARTLTDASGTATARGQYKRQGSVLMVQPQGQMPMQFMIRELKPDRLVLVGMDGSVLSLSRAAAAGPHEQTSPGTPPSPAKIVPAPAPGNEPATTLSPRPSTGNSLVPDWVQPGLRLTYDLLTGSVAGSVNGWVLDEDGNFVDRSGNRYSTERQGHSSHGLVEATVAGMDAQVVALSQPFYLLSPNGTLPLLKSHMDTLATLETGGDFWMHPQKQAMMMREHPWTGAPRPGQMLARARTWRSGNRSWNATAIISIGDAGRTFWVYDQASGRLLYLSRISRGAPDIRDPAQTLPDSVSYATFLRFVGATQPNLPWLNTPMPEWTRRLQVLSYQGQLSVQFPGAAPGGTALSQQMEVAKRGSDWLLFQSRSRTQGLPATSGSKSVTGPGCLPPVIVPPAALDRLHAGQEIDRDPYTGFTTRVVGMDAQTATLETEGPLQSFVFVFDRVQGVLIHTLTRERSQAGVNQVVVHEMQLAEER
jgi:hypothetical protein